MDDDFKLGAMNHVGVAVPDMTDAIAFYRDVMGATEITEPKILAPQGVTYAFVNLPTGQVELIEPYGETSPILKFLERNPKGGQHHMCFEVEDIHHAKDIMENRGMRVLGEPRIGAHGTPVVFLHPGDAGGVLIELMETHKEH
jgi:methylmalonyl-CoA/ethylmalonyl-CoA epimerase